jgi:hypothetical protein
MKKSTINGWYLNDDVEMKHDKLAGSIASVNQSKGGGRKKNKKDHINNACFNNQFFVSLPRQWIYGLVTLHGLGL